MYYSGTGQTKRKTGPEEDGQENSMKSKMSKVRRSKA